MAKNISKGGLSTIQNDVDDLINQCKELRIGFSKLTTHFEPIEIHHNLIEVVRCAKVLIITVSSDLKLNKLVQQITKKARKKIIVLPNPIKESYCWH